MKRKVTMQEISDIVGVSKVTVSKVFNNRTDVSDEVKQRVLKVAKELGYRYHAGVKTSKTSRLGNVGIVVPEVFLEPDENFYVHIYKHIYKEAEKLGYSTILSVINKDQLNHNDIPNICSEHKVDGLIILGELPEHYIKESLMPYDIPIVLVDFALRDADLDSITTNNFEASYQATNYLISKGHKEIGFVGNIKTTQSIMDRYLGYCKAMMEHDYPVKEEHILKERDDDNHEVDYQIESGLPTAFICNNDKAAFYLIRSLQDMGLRIPDDCSVIGFDDNNHSIFSQPKITTMRVRKDEMARFALSKMHKYINNRKTTIDKLIIDADLIERESVKSI
ncbi:transcriptional regulator, LacI family [Amphibacillus marinus]|uniref:Transcriptional regulator, LacI family n=1 Tax=Amphibacillus marinus TaxID=872970 RepID=A0A1H8QBW3_9BACI|nr:LacI family DNA-binding transcriptional regulator [Amphibacillus marinus]SEO51702.1 transcriptional regulator, LacI family [Amphibacillus marinus]